MLEKEDKVSRTDRDANEATPIQIAQRDSPILCDDQPPLDAVSYWRRITTAYRECFRAALVRIGAELGATPLRCGSPSAPVKLTMAERLSLGGEQVPRGPVSTRGCPFEDL